MKGIVLSLDIGTSSLKAAFINVDGKLCAFSRIAYERSNTISAPSAACWEQALGTAISRLYAQAPHTVPDAVCISGNGPTLVPITDDGELVPLYWYDSRSLALPNGVRSFFLPRAAWLKQHAPADYKRTNFFLSSHEWLAYRLGAEPFTVLPAQAYEPFYWDEDQCRLANLDRGKFPPFVPMGHIAGTVSTKAALLFKEASGGFFKSGTPIVSGSPDFISALIGTGTLTVGQVCNRAGTSEGINLCTVKPAGAGANLRSLPHLKEGLWNVGKLIPESGSCFECYRSITGQSDRPYRDHLTELLPSSVHDGNLRIDPDVFKTLTPFKHNEEACQKLNSVDLGRVVVRSMAFAVRDAVEAFKANGYIIREMRVSGSQGKNVRWNQLKADISGVDLIIPRIIDGELTGSAILAAAALQFGSSLTVDHIAELSATMIRCKKVYKSSTDAAAFWSDQYAAYQAEQQSKA